jgi:nucleotide-binding universal stress UspA family protein
MTRDGIGTGSDREGGRGSPREAAFKRILFPTDFSDTARLAVPLAKRMAAAFGAQLTCLHVASDSMDEWICSWSLSPEEGHATGRVRPGYRSPAYRRLAAFAEEHFGDLALQPGVEIARGRPAETIVRYAAENGFDLIVLGGHAYGDADPGLHETTADRLIRLSSTPVLTVCEPVSEFIRQ